MVKEKLKTYDYVSYFIHKILNFLKGYFNFFTKKSSSIIPSHKGDKVTHRVLGGITAVISGFVLISFVIPFVWLFCYDAVAFNLADKEATYTFSKTEEVQSKDGQFRTYACKQFPCRAQIDSIEFRIRDSVYMDAVWLFTKGQPYDPAELSGAFLSEQNNCNIRYYGRRFKYLGTYPKIISATCEPVQK